MEQKFWIEESKLNEIEWVKKYNLACDKWSKLTPNQIAIKYSYFSVNEHRKFINEICEKLNKGINITTHYQIILGYFNINKSKELKTYSLNYKSKNKKSPNAKMVFLFEKS